VGIANGEIAIHSGTYVNNVIIKVTKGAAFLAAKERRAEKERVKV
jgi:hypothetical protein